jgi:hypothetical protein
METNINRSDFAALELIQMILNVSKVGMETYGESVSELKWALDMIRHEVEQTGRTEPVA